MGSNDALLAILAIGGLGVGAIMFLPQLMKGNKDEERYMGPIEEQGWAQLDREIEAKRRLRELRALDSDDLAYHPTRRIPLMIGQPQDDAYLITDEDFKRLDIGKKDRRFLNTNRKIRDAQLERVVYGDEIDRGYAVPVGSYFSNTVSPYGQGSANEFTRLPGASDLSKVNTRGNTLNLY
jgi:hypothetical protein